MDAQGNITVSRKVSGDQDGDATLFGGVLTNHTSRLFEMLHSKVPQLRYSSLELVSLLLRQGLVSQTTGVQLKPINDAHFLSCLGKSKRSSSTFVCIARRYRQFANQVSCADSFNGRGRATA
jgi:hypothetical protein